MSNPRYLGTVPQGEDEEVAYSVTTTSWGSSPTDVMVVAKDMNNSNTDVSATVLSGDASVLGDVITLPTIKSLTAGNRYRIEVLFTAEGNVLEGYFLINAEL